MKAILVYPGHELWPVCRNQGNGDYAFTVVILTGRAPTPASCLEYIDTHTEMAARTVLDAVNLGIITDWRQLYG
ncbi:hypothetical protein KP1_04 [Klebsiella virus 2019KP1]|nr:hypothetical protein KP1_04 [Klebsiella virus 2019KP1]